MAACMPEELSQTGGTMSTMKELKKTLIILCFLLCLFLVMLLIIYAGVASVVQILKQGPAVTVYSVELVGAKGIGSALDPGAESPAFKLLVRVDNGHLYDELYGGGDLLVSYAGVPLARGRIPAFDVETKQAVAVAVAAGSYGLGIPEDLFRRISEDRSESGVAQLEVEFWLWHDGFFTCNVDPDTDQHHVSQCRRQNFISSTNDYGLFSSRC